MGYHEREYIRLYSAPPLTKAKTWVCGLTKHATSHMSNERTKQQINDKAIRLTNAFAY